MKIALGTFAENPLVHLPVSGIKWVFYPVQELMESTIWNVGSQIDETKQNPEATEEKKPEEVTKTDTEEKTEPTTETEKKPESEETENPEQSVEVDKEQLKADPSLEQPTDKPSEDAPDKDNETDENWKTLQEVIEEKKAHEEKEKREKELDEKVNKELGVEEDEETEKKKEEPETKKEVENEVKREVEDEPVVDIENKSKKLPEEAVKLLNTIKETYDKTVIDLRVENKMKNAEIEILTKKLNESASKIADLSSNWASASNKALYFDKVMESGDKWKITDYLIDLMGIYYPNVSKESLTSLTKKKNITNEVNADLVPKHQQINSAKNRLEQIQSSYSWAYKKLRR